MPDSIIKADNISSLSGGGVGFPDGSVSNPSLKFTNDSDTGLYRIGNNTIGIASNGARVGEIGNGYGGFTGNIIQVVSAIKTDTATISSGSPSVFQDITGLSVNITPKYSNSRMLIKAMISYGADSTGGIRGFFRFMRDSTAIGIGDAASNRVRASFVIEPFWSSYSITMGGMNFLDTVSSINQITYKVQICLSNINSTVYINRDASYADSVTTATSTSSITVMEVQQ